MTRGTATILRTDNEDFDVIDRFCFLGLTIHSKGTDNQEYTRD